jgi:hypothetical protein
VTEEDDCFSTTSIATAVATFAKALATKEAVCSVCLNTTPDLSSKCSQMQAWGLSNYVMIVFWHKMINVSGTHL